jgi:hypothetical protein
MMTLRAGLTAGFIPFQDRAIECVCTVLAFVFNGWHALNHTVTAPAAQ